MTRNKYLEPKKRVMIVDDSRFNQELLSEILGDKYEYLYADDGDIALDLLSQDEQVDILLLDMNMPNLNGMEFLKIMNARDWTKEIPVVIVSEETDMGVMQNAYSLGAVDYMIRPFNAFLVKHRVENTLLQYSQKKKLAELVASQIFKRKKMNNILVHIFSNIVEMRNSESGGHTLRVQRLTKMLLERLVRETDAYSFSDEDISMISTAAALHDIGKVRVPIEILNKTGKLTDEEWKIMQAHTINGDEFLRNVVADDSDQFMVFAHEICRYHHERYDGKGYPDGLIGDEIPISAQVVALADVYDALTNDRCYKKAYSHEQAVSMILGGECGAFNPLLIQCFTEIADELMIDFKEGEEIDGVDRSLALTREAFYNEKIRIDERSHHLAEYEMQKKDFFAERCGGILFEYNVERRKVLYMRYYNTRGERQHLPAETTHLLKAEDLKDVEERVRGLSPENPTLSKNVLVSINGDMRWHVLTLQGVWGKSGGGYKYIVGHFANIHDQLIARINGLLVKGKSVSGEGVLALRKIFEIVRLVDPTTCKILKITENGDLFDTDECCYSFWNRGNSCSNCSSGRAFVAKHWASKVEMKDGHIYSVVSRRVQYKERDCVLELAFNIDESIEKSQDEIGYNVFDVGTFKNYYRDTVTKMYSRAYFDNFSMGFENAKGIAVIDLNKFKAINDHYGHPVGDKALRHVANLVKSCIRKEDEVIRYGGDEFLLIFFDISEQDFYDKLQAIKQAVHVSKIDGYPDLQVDISIGGAYGVRPLKKAIDIADKAMYKDKFRIDK